MAVEVDDKGTPQTEAPKPPDYDPNISIASTDPADAKLNVAPDPEAKPAEPVVEEPKVEEVAGEVPDGAELDAKGEVEVEDPVEEPKEGDKPKTKKRRRRYTNQARINHAMRRAYRAEAENTALKEAAAERDGAPAPRKPVVAKEPEAPAPKKAEPPKRDDFEDVEDYIIAKAQFGMEEKVEKRLKEERLASDTRANAERDRATAAEADEAHAQELGDWQTAVDKQAEDPATPDFDEVIEASEDVPINAPMRDFMMDSPVGPRMLYELAKNIEVAEQIHGLPPLRALAAMGRLEASLDSAPKPKPAVDEPKPAAEPKPEPKPAASPTPVSTAPEPITPVGGGATTVPVELGTADYQTYKKIENARELANRGVGR